ncbi:general stress protein [Nostoc sp. CHAB 5824]|nr:general stress protein [Nostoc sp. CHAB 5824]
MIIKDTIRALGVFANSQGIEQAVNELKTASFPMEKVSVIAKDVEQGDRVGEAQISDHIGDQDVNTTGAVREALTASTWGSVLVGLSSLALPGLGAVLAAGSVGVALVSSVAGVAVGAAANQNLLKALGDLGIPEDRARVYSDRLQQSYYLLILEGSEEEIHHVEPILRNQGIEYWGVYDSSHTSNGGVH